MQWLYHVKFRQFLNGEVTSARDLADRAKGIREALANVPRKCPEILDELDAAAESGRVFMSRAQAQRIIDALGSCEAAMAERDRIAAGLPTAEEIEEAAEEHCPRDYAPPVRE